MSSVNERIEKLKQETNDLRKEVKDLKETIMQQNELIIRILSQQSGMLDEAIQTEKSKEIHGKKSNALSSRRFPLEDLEDLKKFELEINEDNRMHIINIVESLLSPQGLMKNIVNVLTDNLIMESNVDGHHNKTRLLNFPKTIDVLFMASREKDDYTDKMFLEDLRRSLRMVKNRCHKNNCRARKKQQQRQQLEEHVHQQQEECDETSFMLKTEEIYFE
ncbi:uncharacterized protein ACRADG_009792 [Cochliomyia hominivorax]